MESDEDEEIDSYPKLMLALSALYPPNEINTQRYELDKHPQIRLLPMTHFPSKAQPNLAQTDMPVCQKVAGYMDQFKEADTLGNFYQKNENKLIYRRLNNSNYNSYKTNQKTIKYFPALFIPYTQMSKALKNNPNKMYMNLQNITELDDHEGANEYNSQIRHLFGSNSVNGAYDPIFTSNYQSGNLFAVFRIKPYHYALILQNDINSKGSVQWFHFTVKFPEEANIVFLIQTKSHSLYEKGMKIVCHESANNILAINSGAFWTTVGENITYQRGAIKRQMQSSDYYYQLSYSYRVRQKYSPIIFASSYPYSGLDLDRFFSNVIHRKNRAMKILSIKIGQAISGSPIFVYSIYNHIQFKNQNENSLIPESKIKSLVFMARQHPGQSHSSFLVEGIVEFLNQSKQYELLKNYHFYIIPMINIDGVQYGNYRTNLAGYDLNRVWNKPHPVYHPEVYCVKKFILQINKSFSISLIIDIHGHSKSLNSFFYGNPTKKEKSSLRRNSIKDTTTDSRLFPYFCFKRMKQISYLQSTFTSNKNKRNSARVVLGQALPNANIYTLENSLYGWKQQASNQVFEYTPKVLREIGYNLVKNYLEFTKIRNKNVSIDEKWLNQIKKICADKDMYDTECLEEDSDSGASRELLQMSDIQQLHDFKSVQPNIPSTPVKKATASYGGRFASVKRITNKESIDRIIKKTENSEKQNKLYNKQVYLLRENESNLMSVSGSSQGLFSCIALQKAKPFKKNHNYNRQKSSIALNHIIMNKQVQKKNRQQNGMLFNSIAITAKKRLLRSIRSSNMRSFLDKINIQKQKEQKQRNDICYIQKS